MHNLICCPTGYFTQTDPTFSLQIDRYLTSADGDLTASTSPSSPDWENDDMIAYYSPDVKQWTDYYCYGMIMSGRNGNSAEYNYGFNGMEKDDEIKGAGNSYDFGARIYDPRVGRWLSGDPLESRYAGISTYAYVNNSPVYAIDPDGEQIVITSDDPEFRKAAFTELQKLTNERLILLKDGRVVSYSYACQILPGDQEFSDEALSMVEIWGAPITSEEQNLESGTLLVDDLLADNNIISIVETTGGHGATYDRAGTEGGDGVDVTVKFNPNPNSNPNLPVSNSQGYMVEEPCPTHIALGHELIHAQHASNGNAIAPEEEASHDYQIAPERTNSHGDARPAYIKTQTEEAEELRTVGVASTKSGDITENDLRKEHNLNPRVKY